MKTYKIMPYLLLLLAIISSSCSFIQQYTGPDVLTIENSEWKLREVYQVRVPESSRAKIGFDTQNKSSFNGNNGCNNIFGNYKANNTGSLSFSNGASTKMACMEKSIMQIERLFDKALQETKSYELKQNKLFLYDANKQVIAKFSAMAKKENKTALEGSWELTYITGPRITFDGLYPNKKPSIEFNQAESRASGNASCNSYNAGYKTEGTKITFNHPAATLMACENNTGEETYLKLLQEVRSYKVSASELLFYNAQDIVLMKFKRK